MEAKAAREGGLFALFRVLFAFGFFQLLNGGEVLLPNLVFDIGFSDGDQMIDRVEAQRMAEIKLRCFVDAIFVSVCRLVIEIRANCEAPVFLS